MLIPKAVFFMLLLGGHRVLAADDHECAAPDCDPTATATANEEEHGYCQGDEQDSSFCTPAANDLSPQDTDIGIVDIHSSEEGTWKGLRGQDGTGFYACGAQLRIDERTDDKVDSTAVNGLKMKFCNFRKWSDGQETVLIHDRSDANEVGVWKNMAKCPARQWISGARVYYLDNRKVINGANGDQDKLAITGLEILCRDRDAVEEWRTVGKLANDVLASDDVESSEEVNLDGKLIRKANVQSKDWQGSGDDLGISGLKFEVMLPTEGRWEYIGPDKAAGTSFDALENVVKYDMHVKMEWGHKGRTTEGTQEDIDAAVASVQSSFDWKTESGGTKFYGPGDFVSRKVSFEMKDPFAESTMYTVQVNCPSDRPKLWQWHMERHLDAFGPSKGFLSWTDRHACTEGGDEPQCPVGFCKDGDTEHPSCLGCTDQFINGQNDYTLEPSHNIDFTDGGSYDLTNADIKSPAPPGVARALYIESQGGYAQLSDISYTSECTFVLGIYLEEIGSERSGWILNQSEMSEKNGRGIYLSLTINSGKTKLKVGISSTDTEKVSEELTNRTSKWIQIAARFRNKNCDLFLDDVKVLENVQEESYEEPKNKLLYIGKSTDSSYASWVKDVKIYDRALTDFEVEELFIVHKEETTPRIDCGDGVTVHACSACSSDQSGTGCGGDCAWDYSISECIQIPPVNCGTHTATNCGKCGGRDECNGDCEWHEHPEPKCSKKVCPSVSCPSGQETFTNVALDKETSQISTHDDLCKSSIAVDGNTRYRNKKGGDKGTHTHTMSPPPTDAWWMVTLGNKYVISQIIIYNRYARKPKEHIELVSKRLQGYRVEIFNGDNANAVWTYDDPTPKGYDPTPGKADDGDLNQDSNPHPDKKKIEIDVQCPIVGDRVKISLPGKQEHLHLREVEVMSSCLFSSDNGWQSID